MFHLFTETLLKQNWNDEAVKAIKQSLKTGQWVRGLKATRVKTRNGWREVK